MASPLLLNLVGAVAAPLAVGAIFRQMAASTPADKRATYNAATHAAVAGLSYWLATKKWSGTKGHLAQGAMYGEATAAAFALAGPQILNATGAAKFAGQLNAYYGLE